MSTKARRQEMKWGVFFCKKKWKMGGCLFVKKVEMGCFCKKVDLSSTQGHYVQYRYFLFYILLIWGVRTHPTHPPPPTGLAPTEGRCSRFPETVAPSAAVARRGVRRGAVQTMDCSFTLVPG